MGGNFGRALGTAIPQALSNITSMQNLAVREDVNRRAEETHQITMAEQKREAEKAAQEEKRLNSTMDITVHPMFSALPQDQQPKILDFFAKNNLADASGKGSIRNIMTGVKMLEGSKSLFTEFMAPVVEGKKQTYLQKNAELQEATSKGDAKKIQELTPIVNQLRTDYLGSLNNFGEHVAKLEEIETQEEAKETKTYEENTKEVHLGGGKFQEFQLNPKTGKYDIPLGQPYTQAQKSKPETANSGLERENKELTIRGKAANLAGKKMSMKYGKDAFFVNTITGDTFMNPNYGTPEQRQKIMGEWEQVTEGYLPKSMRSKEVVEKPTTEKQATMPPASQHKNRTITDTVTGKRYKSNGTKWMEIK